jgi:4,5-DOPA dioxygenase extradiol
MSSPHQQPPVSRPHDTACMPILFVGHGTPMNAIEDNAFSRGWKEAARAIPTPRAILCVSAHWETRGTFVTAMEQPRTIHDFGGFPQALYDVRYPALGDPKLAQKAMQLLAASHAAVDEQWGLDHGCWSVLRQMYPAADIPVVQLSLDATLPASAHYELARALEDLRHDGVLILGSGNLVHNLRRVVLQDDGPDAFNKPYGFDWALEANATFKQCILEGRHADLANYKALGNAVQLAVPTPEHYLPMLYVLAVKRPDETVAFFNDLPVGGSLTMTSFIIGG